MTEQVDNFQPMAVIQMLREEAAEFLIERNKCKEGTVEYARLDGAYMASIMASCQVQAMAFAKDRFTTRFE